MYNLIYGFYEPMTPNELGHYIIAPMPVELGVWEGTYQNQQMLWLRWWDLQGYLLLTGQKAAELERQKRMKLTEKLRALTPEQVEILGIALEELD